VGGIKDGERLGITENRRGTLKTGAMVAQIFLGLFGVPLKNIPQRATSIAGCHRFAPMRLAAERPGISRAGYRVGCMRWLDGHSLWACRSASTSSATC
jgi:hypothetical protein